MPLTLEVDRQCHLHNVPAALRTKLRAALTIDNPKYAAAQQFGRWIGKKLKPQLFFFLEEGERLSFPRGFGNEAVRLCRGHLGEMPEIIDQRRLLPEIELSFTGVLRAYQEEAVQAVCAHTFGVLEAGTGSGKTIMALGVLARRRQPTLILVHSKELLQQWCQRIEAFLNFKAGQAGDGKFDLQPITVAIVNTARKHLDVLPAHFGQLIVDECHRVPASLFTDVVSAFDCRYMLGLSATAFRREDGMTRLINIYMGDPVHRVDSRLLAESGAVVKPELVQKETGFHYGYQGQYASLLKALTLDMSRNRQIVADIVQLVAQGHRGTLLLVSDRIGHCEQLAALLQGAGVEVGLLTGQVGSVQRAELVVKVQRGELAVLIATLQLIGEGFDCPGLHTLVLATPIKFEGRLLQVVGRIMRPEKKKRALVFDYVDAMVPVLQRSAEARRQVFSQW